MSSSQQLYPKAPAQGLSVAPAPKSPGPHMFQGPSLQPGRLGEVWNAVCKLCKVRQERHEILEQEDFLVGIFPTLKGPWETQRRQDVQPCDAPWEHGQPARDTTRLPFPGPARGGGGTKNNGGQQTESRTIGEAGTWTPCHDPGPRQHTGSLQLSHPQTELGRHREASPPSHGPSLWDHCLDPHIHWAPSDGRL